MAKQHTPDRGSTVRWQSLKVMAMGSFPTDLEVDRERYRYSKYDCYFSLGGFDNRTTYVMVPRSTTKGATEPRTVGSDGSPEAGNLLKDR